VVPISEFVLD